MNKTKSFQISKQLVFEAWKRVRENQGAAGVDGQTIEEFEKDLKRNLYRLWNRMSSGAYFPPPVRAVAIPKDNGGTRVLGIPTVADRVAQMVVKMILEPKVDPLFHEDSYGYRPAKSAHQALEKARVRCWQKSWVIDLDIKGFFDHLDHERLMKALSHHTQEKWILLYTERWLKAPMQDEKGVLHPRDQGSPQGGVISPLLANLFLHYAFDQWMRREHPAISFERYADDIVAHCATEVEAKRVLECIRDRLLECKLELSPEKTHIVYCKDSNRGGKHEKIKFDFLGFTFRPRLSVNKRGEFFVSFLPAMSTNAATKIRQKIRSWELPRRTDKQIGDLARMFNAQVEGWINYYGRFYKSAMYDLFHALDQLLIRWARYKYKRFYQRPNAARRWLKRIMTGNPDLFAHWRLMKWLNEGSRMNREVHVRF